LPKATEQVRRISYALPSDRKNIGWVATDAIGPTVELTLLAF